MENDSQKNIGKEKSNKKMMIASFIGIIAVVLGHVGYNIRVIAEVFPYYSFNIVLFIFISGYFYKPKYEENIWGKNGYFFKKIKKLVIPYYIWNLIYGIIVMFLKKFNIIEFGENINIKSLLVTPWINGHQYQFNLAAWFLLALFLVNIVYILIRKLMNKTKLWNDYIALAVFFVTAIISVSLAKKGIKEIYIPIIRTGFLMFFYQLGYVYKTKIEGRIEINTIIYFTLIIAVQVLIFIIDNKVTYIVVFMQFKNKFLITPIIVGVTGILFWTKVSELLVPLLGKNKIINYISNHTYDIMLHHLFGIFVLNAIIGKISILCGINGFNMEWFRYNIYYFYTPGTDKVLLIYAIISIIIPLSVRYYCDKIKNNSKIKVGIKI